MKVALDVSPLRLTRAGSARYVEGLRRELPKHVELRELTWGGSGRATAALRDAGWYPLGLPRAARGADVLLCSELTFSSGVPVLKAPTPCAAPQTASSITTAKALLTPTGPKRYAAHTRRGTGR